MKAARKAYRLTVGDKHGFRLWVRIEPAGQAFRSPKLKAIRGLGF